MQGKVVDPQVADRLDQVERLPRHCLEPGPRHDLQILGRKGVDSVKEVDEARVILPVAGIVAMGQGRDAPRRKQRADRWARCERDEPVDHPYSSSEESLKSIPKPEPPGDPGHQAGRTIRHPGAHIDRVGRTGT